MYYKARVKARSNGMRYHVAAILRRGKSIVTVRANDPKTCPQNARDLPGDGWTASHHAETYALRQARPGDDLEVLRWGRRDTLLCSKPCPMCMARIREAGIRRLTYIDREGNRVTVRP